MVENNRAETRRLTHQMLLSETDNEVKKFNTRIRIWMWIFCIVVGIVVGGAIAIWSNTGLGMLLGGLLFTTMGASVLALGAMPSQETILDMGGTYWNGNKYLVAELRKNRLLAQRGIYFIFIGYLFFTTEMALRIVA